MRLRTAIICWFVLTGIVQGQSFDVFNGGRGHFWAPNDTFEVTVRTAAGATETYQMKWPIDSGDPNQALCTDGGIDAQLFWGGFGDANGVLPKKTPWNVMYVGADRYPLTEDPNYFTYYAPERAFGVGFDGYANNYIQVKNLLEFDPNLFNVTIGMGSDDTTTGPNNVRVGHGAGDSLLTATRNTLGGKDAGTYLQDANDNTAWGYKSLGGNGIGGISDYPTLRTTTTQADPGLTHTTAIANVTELQAMNSNLAGNYYLTGNIDASATSGWNGGAGPNGP